MNHRTLPLFAAWIATLISVGAGPAVYAQTKHDPFAAPGDAHAGAPSLKTHPFADYTVHGIIILQDRLLATVRAPGGGFYIIRPGSRFGREDVEIETIADEGVWVATESGRRLLPLNPHFSRSGTSK